MKNTQFLFYSIVEGFPSRSRRCPDSFFVKICGKCVICGSNCRKYLSLKSFSSRGTVFPFLISCFKTQRAETLLRLFIFISSNKTMGIHKEVIIYFFSLLFFWIWKLQILNWRGNFVFESFESVRWKLNPKKIKKFGFFCSDNDDKKIKTKINNIDFLNLDTQK